MWRWLTLFLVVLASFSVTARSARADQSTAHSLSVAVLSFDSDDSEDQADALTGALRSRIRASQGWSLIETTQSLGMLTTALRCPGKPLTADCEQRIADHIHSDRYIFGYLTKGPSAGQVTAEIHLYQKSKPDTVIKETYADNLKDQNDDNLRHIAQHVLEKLGGNAVGTLVVRMGTESGEVVVDGEKKIPLTSGHARLELGPGSHSVEVTPTGRPPQKRTVLVTAGKETVVDLVLQTTTTAQPAQPEKTDKPFPVRKLIGGIGMAVGVGLEILAIVELGKYNDLKDKANASGDLSQIDTKGQAVDACSDEARIVGSAPGSTSQPCNYSKDAKTASTIGIVSAAAGGVFLIGGAILFFYPSGESTEKTAKKKIRVTPTIGGLSLSGQF